ncbi:uncharacterized protein LOC125674710 isoform X2 [Ostrea edulis]|nr:uncharacterized protein LOC125674710 isoform X2 [Ostrea edulis]XP_048767915.2 uncharacterized protein LOC125674710 isoform X2 [Ostrea edulis]XP_048767916.2 uncharacterized protein LOC125674710 isoform X2 [Ostrea edulis]XP_048767917.2 uncharacterized protein LOC125674710 isoform X2 [Ostrea edulis]XP_048767918.2 uncharacterized protein LOC125674710 isoform X2 [Ostrea edulis]XP_056016403.1 uncharacterized protein LOC125674710 isoform X2 [Ostrea edulis]
MMNSDDEYKFNPERKYQGLALVVVNFTSGPDKRIGSENDVKYLKKTFKRLGFKVVLKKDVSRRKFTDILYKYSKDDLLNDYESFVFAISTHGMEVKKGDGSKRDIPVHHHVHVVQMFDGSYFDTGEILDRFSSRKCKALRGKPKLFFIQACRIRITELLNQQTNSETIGFDPGASSHDRHGVLGGKQDTVDSPHGFHGREPDRIITENIEDQESTELINEDDSVSDTDVDDDSDVEDDEYFPADSDVEDDEDFPAVTSEASHNSNSPLVQETGDMLDLPKEVLHQPSKERLGLRDAVDVQGVWCTTVQASVHITAVPCHDDMLIMFASPQGHYAIRSLDVGSYMLKFLYESVKTVYGEGEFLNNRTNFLYVLNDVADKMSDGAYFGKDYKNVTCVVHKLSKDIIFSQGEKMQHSKFSKVLQKIKGAITGN